MSRQRSNTLANKENITLMISAIALIVSVLSLIASFQGNRIAFSNSTPNIVALNQNRDKSIRVLAFSCYNTYTVNPSYFIVYRTFDSIILANRGGRDVALINVSVFEDDIEYKTVYIYPNISSLDGPQQIDLPINIPSGNAVSLAMTVENDVHFESLNEGEIAARQINATQGVRGKSIVWIYSFSDGTELKTEYRTGNYHYEALPDIETGFNSKPCN